MRLALQPVKPLQVPISPFRFEENLHDQVVVEVWVFLAAHREHYRFKPLQVLLHLEELVLDTELFRKLGKQLQRLLAPRPLSFLLTVQEVRVVRGRTEAGRKVVRQRALGAPVRRLRNLRRCGQDWLLVKGDILARGAGRLARLR